MKNKFFKTLAALVSLALIAAALVSCTPSPASVASVGSDAETVGTGGTSFAFAATMLDKTQKNYVVKTDKETVGDALLDAGLISGSDGPFGLYIDTVCGEKHLYEEDGKFWAFYVDGAMAPTGADQTKIEPGKVYELRAE